MHQRNNLCRGRTICLRESIGRSLRGACDREEAGFYRWDESNGLTGIAGLWLFGLEPLGCAWLGFFVGGACVADREFAIALRGRM
ncbi:MAG: hypothetical protein JST22_00920 [Bacteroidetes bacterium]|nr:hypothetical protein [Bacteroidota bacterium]